MTKSGIGTQQNQQNLNTIGTTSSSTTNTIGTAEIPIWVADKKKWVTGISKKTTINDLIYAILKQCQLVPTQNTNSQTGESNNLNLIEQISSQYVLTEYQYEPSTQQKDSEQQFVLSSQRILDGEAKVYKYLNKWSQISTTNNLMLKILQRELVPNESESVNSNQQSNHHHSNSLASKLLKKIGVSSSSSSSTLNSNNLSNANNNQSSSKQQSSSNHTTPLTYRYVEVKLPNQTQITSTNNNNNTNKTINQSNSFSSTNTSNSTLQRNSFDPNTQKAFIYNTILDRENRLKQQKEKFQLLDEMIKESEKKGKYSSNMSLFSNTINPNLNSTPLSPTSNLKQLNTNSIVDLNDIYYHFPEMCTHNLNEVEDFTLMCCQLFQLEEAIKNQKQVLTNLEMDLQRELNSQNHTQHLNANTSSPAISNQNNPNNIQANESPETIELRKEVNQSREQTRVQCKQLHDLDLRMRQNEQNLMSKEQQLNQLLEELYVQEVYTDNANDPGVVTNIPVQLNNSVYEPKDNVNLNEDDNLITDKINLENDLAELKITNTNSTNTQQSLNSNQNDLFSNRQTPIFTNHQSLKRDNRLFPNQDDNINNTTTNLTNLNSNLTNQQLNQTHKSLSFGNLLNPINSNVSSNLQASPNQKLLLNNKFTPQSAHQTNTLVKTNSTKIKTSPSLDINTAKNGVGLIINSNDQLGETDSGISSMSSETATSATTTTNSSSSSSTSSTSSTMQTTTIINSNSPNSIPIMNSALFYSNSNPKQAALYQPNQQIQINQQQSQYQYQIQQRQYIQQQHQSSIQINKQVQINQLNQQIHQQNSNNLPNTAKQIKSVLETLV